MTTWLTFQMSSSCVKDDITEWQQHLALFCRLSLLLASEVTCYAPRTPILTLPVLQAFLHIYLPSNEIWIISLKRRSARIAWCVNTRQVLSDCSGGNFPPLSSINSSHVAVWTSANTSGRPLTRPDAPLPPFLPPSLLPSLPYSSIRIVPSRGLHRRRANNKSSEVCDIIKPGRRVKLNRSQAVNVHKLMIIRYLPTASGEQPCIR